jgi:hypothetical protein
VDAEPWERVEGALRYRACEDPSFAQETKIRYGDVVRVQEREGNFFVRYLLIIGPAHSETSANFPEQSFPALYHYLLFRNHYLLVVLPRMRVDELATLRRSPSAKVILTGL